MIVLWGALGAALLVAPGSRSGASLRADALARRGRLRSAGRAASRSDGRPSRLPRRGLAALSCAAAALIGAAAGGPVVAAAGAAASAVAAWLALRAVRRRATERRAGQLLSALRLLTAELSAGAQLVEALTAAADAAPACAGELRAAAAAVGAGEDPGPSLQASPDLAAVAAAWRVAEKAGAPLAAVLDRVGDDLDDRIASRRAVGVATAGARSSAALLALLPLLGVALAAALGARPGSFLLHSPAGRLVLLAGVLLDAAGALWTARLVDSAERVR